MANPFDVYDEKTKGSNAFDKYDPKTPSIADGIVSALKAEPKALLTSLIQAKNNLGTGLLQGVTDTGVGAGQLLLNGANGLYNWATSPTLSSTVTGKRNTPLQAYTDRYNEAVTERENDYQNATPGSFLAGTGRLMGNFVLPIKPVASAVDAAAAGVTKLIPQSLKTIPMVSAPVGAAVKGAATAAPISLTQPVPDVNNDFLDRKLKQAEVAAAFGGSIPIAGKVLGGIADTGKVIFQPKKAVADNLARAASSDVNAVPVQPQAASGGQTAQINTQSGTTQGNFASLNGARTADEVLSRIEGRKNFVAGSKPTTAQVVATPEIVMAEGVLNNNPAYKAAMVQRQNENNAARLSAIDQVAKTPEELAAAVQARKDAVDPLYSEAWAQNYPVDETLAGLLKRPSVQAAIARGKKLAAEVSGDASSVGVKAGEAPQVAPVNNPFSGVGGTVAPAEAAATAPDTINGQTLQYLKMGLQDLQQEGSANGMGAHEKGALQNTFDLLHSWMRDNAPKYRAADDAYAQLSKPINDMRVGQAVRSALSDKSFNSSGDVGLTLNNVKGAIKTALNDEGHYGISPDAEALLSGVKGDLQRQSISGSIPFNGSNTVYNLQAPNWLSGKLFGENLSGEGNTAPIIAGGLTLLGDMAGGAGLMSSTGLAGLAAAGTKKATQFIGGRANKELQQAMLDPDYFAQLLKEGLARRGEAQGGLLGSSIPEAGSGFVGGLLGN